MTTTDEAIALTARRRRIARVNRLLRTIVWQRQTIAILTQTAGQPISMRDIEADVAGGLAVHRSHNFDELTGAFDTWTITHVQSGYAVMNCIPTERHARIVAVRLLALGDWAGDQESVRPIYEPHRQAIAGWYIDAYAGPDEEETTP